MAAGVTGPTPCSCTLAALRFDAPAGVAGVLGASNAGDESEVAPGVSAPPARALFSGVEGACVASC